MIVSPGIKYSDIESTQGSPRLRNNGCQAVASNSLNITEFDPGVVLAVTDPSCNVMNDGSIDLSDNGNGAYEYLWSGNGVDPTAQDQTNLEGGTYLVTITDPNSLAKKTMGQVSFQAREKHHQALDMELYRKNKAQYSHFSITRWRHSICNS